MEALAFLLFVACTITAIVIFHGLGPGFAIITVVAMMINLITFIYFWICAVSFFITLRNTKCASGIQGHELEGLNSGTKDGKDVVYQEEI